jgi:hypothetical protein
MTVSDLIKMVVDIDVYDSVLDDIGIAFCGPLELTDEGKKKFGEVLDYEVCFRNSQLGQIAVVDVDDKEEDVWRKKLANAKNFFWSAAGYCRNSDFEKWFILPDLES